METGPISEARIYLGQYLFSGDDVYKQVRTLSGRERGRLALADRSLEVRGARLAAPARVRSIGSPDWRAGVRTGFDMPR